MKKLLFGLILLSLSVAIHSKTYEELLQAGKNYETKKEWFYALGAYYDAMKLSDNPEEAKQKYTELSECIKSGKPGYGEFDVFTLHDEWVNLIKNAERFFTERFPYKISVGELEMYDADYNKKTAGYTIDLKIEQTELYKNARDIIQDGSKKANVHEDWNELKQLWFRESDLIGGVATNDVRKGSAYQTKYKAPINPLSYNDLQEEIKKIYKKYGVAISCFPLPNDIFSDYPNGFLAEYPAFVPIFHAECPYKQYYFAGSGYYLPRHTCYDYKFCLYDENGKLLVDGERKTFNFHTETSYYFSNIPQNIIPILDSKKCNAKLMGIWLNYGVYNVRLLTDKEKKDGTIKSVVAPLPDIKLNLDNVEFIDIVKQKREEQERIERQEKILAEKAKVFNEINPYIYEYERRKTSAQYKMMETMKNIGVELDQLDNYKVIKVITSICIFLLF